MGLIDNSVEKYWPDWLGLAVFGINQAIHNAPKVKVVVEVLGDLVHFGFHSLLFGADAGGGPVSVLQGLVFDVFILRSEYVNC